MGNHDNSQVLPPGYISLYCVAKLLGVNDNILRKDKQKRSLFEKRLDEMSELTSIRKIELAPPVSVDGLVHNACYNENDTLNFLDTHITLSYFEEQLDIVHNTLRNKIRYYNIQVISLGGTYKTKYIPKQAALLHITNDQNILAQEFEKGYISIYDVAELVGRNIKGFQSWNTKERFAKQLSKLPAGKIEMKRMGRLIKSDHKFHPDDRFYKKSDVEKFLETHITIENLELNFGNRSLKGYRSVQSYKLGPEKKNIFLPSESLKLIPVTVQQDEILDDIYSNEDREWITSWEFAGMLNISTDMTRKFARLFYIQLLEDLSNKQIIICKKTIDVSNSNQIQIFVDKISANLFIADHMTKSDLSNLLLGTRSTINKFIKDHHIPEYKLGSTIDQIYLPRASVMRVIEPEIKLSDYVSVHVIGSFLGMDPFSNNIYRIYDRIKNLPNEEIRTITLEHPMIVEGWHSPQKVLFHKIDVTSFFSSHVSINDAAMSLSTTCNCIVDILNKLKLQKYVLGGHNNRIYISKETFKKIHDYIDNRLNYTRPHKNIKKRFEDEYFMQKEAYKILNLSRTQFLLLIEERGLETQEGLFGSVSYRYYSKKNINELKTEQMELLKNYKENYYSSRQMVEKFDPLLSGFTHMTQAYYAPNYDVEFTECPTILLGLLKDKSKKASGRLYLKSDVDELFFQKITGKMLQNTKMDNPFEEFVFKVEHILHIDLTVNSLITKELWYQYVRQSLLNSESYELMGMVNQFVRTTETLHDCINKEIYLYTSFELNKLIFDRENEIPRRYQQSLFHFCKKIHEYFLSVAKAVPFNIEQINNPYEYPTLVEHDLTIYTYDEYQSLYNYVANIDLHKKNAIKDIETFKQGKQNLRYDSCWLYIIVHLTNNWRHSTVVTQIPKIDLSNTNILSLDWLKNNNPSLEDANDIIFQIGRSVKEIHKTGAESEFRIGEALKIAFAIAISICTFRDELVQNDKSRLISLGNKELSTILPKTHAAFFEFYQNKEFIFQNRKMNRTLSTLIWSVFRHLKDTQVSRSHFNEDTSMKYIKMNDAQIHNLVNQLFERGIFGHFSQLLTNILFGKDTDRYLETEKMKIITSNFGEVQKIEVTSGLLARISKERTEVLNFLLNKNNTELKELFDKAISGTLYSKKHYYQCVFTECKFDDSLDCADCHFSIVNVYALSNLMSTYLKHIKHIIEKFTIVSEGEKSKMANHFFIIHRLVKNARETFGDVIYDFVEGGRGKFRELQELFPETKLHLTRGMLLLHGSMESY